MAHPHRVDRLVFEGPSGLAGPLAGQVQSAGFDAVAGDAAARDRIRRAAGGGAEAVWEVADRQTVDRFLFHRAGTAERVRGLWDELAERIGPVNRGAMQAALARQPARSRPLIDELAALDVPTLILVGPWDRNVGIDVCRDLATRLPRSRLAVFAHSAHFPSVEETDRFVDEVLAFTCDPQPAPRPGRLSVVDGTEAEPADRI